MHAVVLPGQVLCGACGKGVVFYALSTLEVDTVMASNRTLKFSCRNQDCWECERPYLIQMPIIEVTPA